MVIATDTTVPAEVVDEITRQDGVQSARAIELG